MGKIERFHPLKIIAYSGMVSRVLIENHGVLMISNDFLEQNSAEKSTLNENRAAGQVKHSLYALGIA